MDVEFANCHAEVAESKNNLSDWQSDNWILHVGVEGRVTVELVRTLKPANEVTRHPMDRVARVICIFWRTESLLAPKIGLFYTLRCKNDSQR